MRLISPQLTLEQAEAVACNEKRFVVNASAGSGKTTTLSARYLRFVTEEGYSPRHILAITFTRKAALEMRRRIVSSLLRLGLKDEAQVAETGPISTMHSFCETTLREQALEVGIDPEFDLITDEERSALMLLCLREAIVDLLQSADSDAIGWLQETAGQYVFNVDSPYAVIEVEVGKAIHALRAAGVTRSQLQESYASEEATLQTWRMFAAASAVPEIRDRLLALPEGDFWAECAQWKLIGKPKFPPKDAIGLQEKAARSTLAAWNLIRNAWAKYDTALRQRRCLDLAGLEIELLRALETSATIRTKLSAKYPVVLIDEAQDLNPVQHRLLQAFDESQMMLVGDFKQSIYSFRQAEPQAFLEVSEMYHRLDLSVNHRSQPGLLRYVDRVFDRHWGREYRPSVEDPFDIDQPSLSASDFSGVERWKIPAAQSFEAIASGIEMLIAQGEQPQDILCLVRRNTAAGKLEKALRDRGIPCRAERSAANYYARLEIRDVANLILSLLEPEDLFTMLAVLRGPVGELSFDALAQIASEKPGYDELGLISLESSADAKKLQSFLMWHRPLQQRADRLSAVDILTELFAESPLLARLARRPDGARQVANVRKLLGFAAEKRLMGSVEFSELIRSLARLATGGEEAATVDPDANAVSISTIHSAKGLESPVVIVLETWSSIKPRPRREHLSIDFQSGTLVWQSDQPLAPITQLVHEKASKREGDELLRLVYVALTRAKRKLVIVEQEPAQPATLLDKIMPRTSGLAERIHAIQLEA